MTKSINEIHETDSLNVGREKLNNAIRAFNETVKEGDSSLEAAQARVDEKGQAHNTLKDRIDDGFTKVNSQLAETVQEIIELETSKADKQHVQEELDSKRDKTVSIDENDISTGLLTKMENAGSIINVTSIPKEFSVHERKTTFIKTSSNLYNKNNLIENHHVDRDTGELVPNETADTHPFISVDPDRDYTIKKNAGLPANIVFYDDAQQYISAVVARQENTRQLFTTPENAYFIMVSCNKNNVESMQINKGDSDLPYENYYKPKFSGIGIPFDKNNVKFEYDSAGRVSVVTSGLEKITLNYENNKISSIIEESDSEKVRSNIVYQNNKVTKITKEDI